MLQSYNKLTFLDIDGGLDGLVGKKYPGSTGGEIFNYYGTDANKNVASGSYSTAIGYNCKATGNFSFAGGSLVTNDGPYSFAYGRNIQTAFQASNSVNMGSSNSCIGGGSVILGTNNTIQQDGTRGVTIGSGNIGKNYYGIMIGTDNNSSTYDGSRLIGDRLNAYAKDQFIFGRCNAIPTLANTNFIFGCGTNNTNRANFLEANNTSCKILNNLQLATDTTEVNAIVPPSDPSNPTTAEQTLATKAYVDGHSLGITVPRAEVLLTGQSTTVANGASISLETDLSLTLPSWTKQIRLGIHNSGGYVEYLLVDNINAHSYVSVTGAGTIDEYSYDPATTTFTFVSGGTSMSIVSVRAEGTASI